MSTRPRRRVSAVLVSFVALAGCGEAASPEPTEPPVPSTVVATVATTSPPTTSPVTTIGDPPPEVPAAVVDWGDPDAVIDLGDGWSVRACMGDAPLLCVDREGEAAGTVEALAFQIDAFEGIDPDAATDRQLLAFAEGFVEALGSDRAQGCGDRYRFEPLEPRSLAVGGLAGLGFGFEGSLADGTPSELNLQYATIDGERIVSVVAAAYDDGGCPGRDELSGFTSTDLAAFRPYLDALVARSPLPPVGS